MGIDLRPSTELPANYDDLDDAEQQAACDRVNHAKPGVVQCSLGQYRADIFTEMILMGPLDTAFAAFEASTTEAG